MAFTFVVEDGTGLSTATSYMTLTEANDYIVQNIHAYETWECLDPTTQEYIIAWASRYMDQRARWNGYKTVEDSGLRWPRTGACDIDGNAIDANEVPRQLKEAAAELATYLMETDLSRIRDTDGLERLRVDVIEIYFNKDYRLPSVPSSINLILSGLGSLRGSNNFARILRS